MQQVLLNLYSNAIKFTKKYGKIIIIIEKLSTGGTDQLLTSVIDSGIGIEDHNQSKLFKLFGSIKDEKKKINTQGIGLGLVISKLIVQKFNGTIDYISKFQEGSTFFFSFELDTIKFNEIDLFTE